MARHPEPRGCQTFTSILNAFPATASEVAAAYSNAGLWTDGAADKSKIPHTSECDRRWQTWTVLTHWPLSLWRRHSCCSVGTPADASEAYVKLACFDPSGTR